VYDSVLAVKEYAESLVKPGVKRLEYEKVVRGRMNAELVKLGLWDSPLRKGMRGDSTPETISRYYYPHSTSHFLGLDVHDTGERDDAFEVGMVITCEPGIYIPEE
jgi:Xaa-Pro aminopeptidase